MIVLSVFEPSGAIETSLDVDGVSTWQESPNIVLSVAAPSEEQAAMLTDWQSRQVPQVTGVEPGRAPLSGSGPPDDATGLDGDFYIDVDSNLSYGPKVAGAWPVGVNVVLGTV